MKTADALNATMLALIDVMKTDTRFTVDEMAALAAISVIMTASGDTNKDQDMVVVQCLKKLATQNPNY